MKTVTKTALFKFDDFCAKHKIEYAVTGTCALAILGVPSDTLPKDLDVKIYHADAHIKDTLKGLEALSSHPETYPETGHTTYTFMVNDVKVNVILDTTSDYEDILCETIAVAMVNEAEPRKHCISVQTMQYAWAAKMKLHREKDVRYALNVINLLSLPM